MSFLANNIIEKVLKQRDKLVQLVEKEETIPIDTHFVEIMRAVSLRLIDTDDNTLDLVSASPLDVAGVLIDPPNILTNLRID